MAIISCCLRCRGKSGDMSAPKVRKRMIKSLGNQGVRGHDSGQALVKLLDGLSIFLRVQGALLGHRLEDLGVGVIQRKCANPGHRNRSPHSHFMASMTRQQDANQIVSTVAGDGSVGPGHRREGPGAAWEDELVNRKPRRPRQADSALDWLIDGHDASRRGRHQEEERRKRMPGNRNGSPHPGLARSTKPGDREHHEDDRRHDEVREDLLEGAQNARRLARTAWMAIARAGVRYRGEAGRRVKKRPSRAMAK